MASDSRDPRMTLPTQLVLRALLEEPSREMYGLEICARAGLQSGTIHPILATSASRTQPTGPGQPACGAGMVFQKPMKTDTPDEQNQHHNQN